jgi:hypothetical protein
MVTLKFPGLDKALIKNTKDFPEDAPEKGIIIISGSAIVVNRDFLLVVDLFDYFSLEGGVEDSKEVEDLEKILFLMEGKMFNAAFWKEMTKGADMEVLNGSLRITTPKYSKDLHNEKTSFKMLKPLRAIIDASQQRENVLSSVAIPFGALGTIHSIIPELKNDTIIFEFNDQSRPVKFTFEKRKHFYGIIIPRYDAAQEGFRFESLDNLANNDDFNYYLAEEEAKEKLVPPPPPPHPSMELVKEDEEESVDLFSKDNNEEE